MVKCHTFNNSTYSQIVDTGSKTLSTKGWGAKEVFIQENFEFAITIVVQTDTSQS